MADMTNVPEVPVNGWYTEQANNPILTPAEANALRGFDYTGQWSEQAVTDFWPGMAAGAAGAPNAVQMSDSAWQDLGAANQLETLNRIASRANLIRLMMLADGYSFDSLFLTDPRMENTYKHYMEKTAEFLENGGDLEAAILRAGEQFLDTKLPTLETQGVNVHRADAMAQYILDYSQITQKIEKNFVKRDAYDEFTEAACISMQYCDSLRKVGLYREGRRTVDPEFERYELGGIVGGKAYLDNDGKRFAGMTVREAGQLGMSFHDVAGLAGAYTDGLRFTFASELKAADVRTAAAVAAAENEEARRAAARNTTREQYEAYINDSIGGEARTPYTFARTTMTYSDGTEYVQVKTYERPSKNPQPIKIDFADHIEAYRDESRKAGIFDELVRGFEDNPNEHEEEEIKRFYIDGKNAYEMLARQCRYDRDKIKQAIVDEIASGKSHVEFVRMETQPDGQLSPVILPVTADLRVFDAGKKWYQSSIAKAADRLWSKDSKSAANERKAAILANAAERQEKNLKRMLGLDHKYYDILQVLEEIHGDALRKNADAMEDEKKMTGEPEEVREWLRLKEKRDSLEAEKRNMKPIDKLLGALEGAGTIDINDMDAFNTMMKSVVLPREDRETLTAAAGVWREMSDAAAKSPQSVSEVLMEEEKRALAVEGLKRLKTYLGGHEALTAEEKQSMDRLDDRFLGCHLGPDSSQADRLKYMQAEARMLDVRVMRYGEFTHVQNEIRSAAALANLNDPEELRVHIRRMDRLYKSFNLKEADFRNYMRTLPEGDRPEFEAVMKWVERTGSQPDRMTPDQPPFGMTSLEALQKYTTLVSNTGLYRDGYVDCLVAGIDQREEALEREIRELREKTMNESAAKIRESHERSGNQEVDERNKNFNKGKFISRYDVEFKELFEGEENQYEDGKLVFDDDGPFRERFTKSETCKAAAQIIGPGASRATTWCGLVKAQLLKEGMSWKQVNSKDMGEAGNKRARELAKEVLNIFEDKDEARRGRRIGELLADCAKTISNVKVSDFLSDALGRDMTDKAAAAGAMTNWMDIPVVAEELMDFYKMQREIYQAVNFVKGRVDKAKENVPKAVKAGAEALQENLQGESLEKHRNVDLFLRCMAIDDGFERIVNNCKGTSNYRRPADEKQDELEKSVASAMVTQVILADAAKQMAAGDVETFGDFKIEGIKYQLMTSSLRDSVGKSAEREVLEKFLDHQPSSPAEAKISRLFWEKEPAALAEIAETEKREAEKAARAAQTQAAQTQAVPAQTAQTQAAQASEAPEQAAQAAQASEAPEQAAQTQAAQAPEAPEQAAKAAPAQAAQNTQRNKIGLEALKQKAGGKDPARENQKEGARRRANSLQTQREKQIGF